MAVGESPGWRVEVRDDDVTSVATVIYLLHTECGLSVRDAATLAAHVDQKGQAVVRTFPDQGAAEQLAVALQRLGLHTMVRRP
ncbi:ATP-dependent Clp protease adaptor ClpS [Actinokineospora sp.]|uniref:ATP-dependent Clp protease adaptor ClpS n=1 Tax=Actinokineospora sp. TaxID=1872133 RepID=UPI003D6A1905